MRHLCALVVLMTLAAPACADDAPDDTVLVFAAASLTDAFGEVADAYEQDHPGTTVELNLAGSSSLREQILAGAPADVVASADESNMAVLVDAGLTEDPKVFALNDLQLVVPADNPAGVTGLADLADDDLIVGLCAPEVPCGVFAREALSAAGVLVSPDTEEPDVRALLTKVEAGELDAGIVYRTDVLAAGDGVEGIDLPDEVDVVARYPISTLVDAGEPEAASSFVAFVLSDDGQAILRSHGFGSP